ncbi:MAG: FCD domain-containing protein [Anaerolineales bacterium]|jgi:DNA-binding FadR family transcriptional regulator|nr:FCD domain-containing protein [Anaerolineales bacterium]
MPQNQLSSIFLQYLAQHSSLDQATNGETPATDRLPSLNDVSKELGVSVALLREQVEVAKAIGLVEVRPRTGIRRLPYSFLPAVRQSLSYAIAVDQSHFMEFSDLRNHIEAAYWNEATQLLTSEDHQRLMSLVNRAWEKLNGQPIQIPHEEHRQLHLRIYTRLKNPFVLGLLEAYWEAYEAVGLNLYADYRYLQQVWAYHQEMVEAICAGDFDRGYRALLQHKDLIFHRPDLHAVK